MLGPCWVHVEGGFALIALFALTLALLVDYRNPHPIGWPFRRLSGRFVEDFGSGSGFGEGP